VRSESGAEASESGAAGRPAEGRRERKKRETRERILESARALFLRHGYSNTTVEEIAEAADVAQTTFFNYFQSKAALLREMTSEVSDRLEAMLAEELSTPGTAKRRIAHFAGEAAREVGRVRGLARDVLRELLNTASHPGATLPYLTRVYEPFTRILREGQRAGDTRVDVEARLMAEMVVGTLNIALVRWLDDPDYPFEERLDEFVVLIGELIQRR